LPSDAIDAKGECDHAAHIDRIHVNLVKQGLVTEARAWEYSSFRRCVVAYRYPAGWHGPQDDAINGGAQASL